MPVSVCRCCRLLFRRRLQQRLSQLQQSRQAFHASPVAHATKPPVIQSLYWDTLPPNQRQLAAASWFFKNHHPNRLWTANQWRTQNNPSSPLLVPEVAFFGRSNVGKSSLLNALLHKPGLNPVGDKPGKTQVMTAWGLSPTKKDGGAIKGFKGSTGTALTLLDVPGYGFRSRADWGSEIMQYLSNRKHLRRVFVILDATHGVMPKDKRFFHLLQSQKIPYQTIASKCDRLPEQGGISPDAAFKDTLLQLARDSQPKEVSGILAVGSRRAKDHELNMIGIGHVQWSVLRAIGLDEYAYKLWNDTVKAIATSMDLPQPNATSPHESPDPNSILAKLASDQSETANPELFPYHPRAPSPPQEKPPFSSHSLGLLDEFLAQPLATPTVKPQPPSPWRQPTLDPPPSPLRAAPRGLDVFNALTSATNPKPKEPSLPPPGPGVSRGLNAFLAATQPLPKQKGRTSPSTPSSRSRTGRSTSSQQSSSPPSTLSPPSPPPGPGVSRGMDALLAFTRSKASDQSAAKKGSRRSRRR